MSVLNHQKKICKKFGLSYEECEMEKNVYVSKNIREGIFPIEGKRYIEEWDFSGWYIWSGEEPQEWNLYNLVSVENLDNYNKELLKFLWLERGTRFIIEQDYMNAEFDYRVFNMID